MSEPTQQEREQILDLVDKITKTLEGSDCLVAVNALIMILAETLAGADRRDGTRGESLSPVARQLTYWYLEAWDKPAITIERPN